MRVPLCVITVLLGATLSVVGWYAREVATLSQRVSKIEGWMRIAGFSASESPAQPAGQAASPEPASLEEKP